MQRAFKTAWLVEMAAYCGVSDADPFVGLRPVSLYNAVTTDVWKGQLDFDRACSGPEQRCWLCTELTPWNQAMHGLAFELVELRPGKLRLRPTPHGDIDGDRATVAAKASFLVSWLLQHHRCIDELKVASDVYHKGLGDIGTSFPIRLRPAGGSDSRRNIRGLEVEAKSSSWFTGIWDTGHSLYELEDLDAIGGLERLRLVLHEMEAELAAELARLLRRNATSIKRLEIAYFEVPRQVNHALR